MLSLIMVVLDVCCTVSSEEDFLAVPSSTRGRAKLEDVRKVLV